MQFQNLVIVAKLDCGRPQMEKDIEQHVSHFHFGMVLHIYSGYLVLIAVVYFDYPMNFRLNLLLVFRLFVVLHHLDFDYLFVLY